MWRLLLLVAAIGALGSACSGEELSAQEEFDQRIEKFGETAYTVTYQLDIVNEGEPSASRMVVYSDGTSRRLDHEFAGGAQIKITTEEVRYSCNRGPADEPTCFEFKFPGGSSSPAFGLDTISGQIDFVETYQLSPAVGRTVAGVEAGVLPDRA